MFYGAIDLHSDKSTIGVVNECGERIYKKNLTNDLTSIRKVREPFRVEMEGIVVESTYNWYWLVDDLKTTGYHVHLGNTTASKQHSALVQVGRLRQRPILMTTHCTLFGLLPLALGLGSGAELQRPLAIAVIGGLTVSSW